MFSGSIAGLALQRLIPDYQFSLPIKESLMVLAWVATGVCLWFESRMARLSMRVLATGTFVITLAFVALQLNLGRGMNWVLFGQDLGMCLLAWSITFRAEDQPMIDGLDHDEFEPEEPAV